MAVANTTALWHVTDAAYASDTLASGVFTIGATGTNKTSQSAIARTDLTTGATATNVTSASVPFDATDVGNYIWIPSGVTGFTSNRYRIISVTAGVAALDTAPAASSTAMTVGTVYLGGAMRSPGGCAGAIGAATYQTVNLAGTHTTTTDTNNVAGGRITLTEGSQWIGYHATIGDNVFSSTMLPLFTKGSFSNPIITTATSSQIRNARIVSTHASSSVSSNAANAAFVRSWLELSRLADAGGLTLRDCYLNCNSVDGSGNSLTGITGTSVLRSQVILNGPIAGNLIATDSVFYRNASGVVIVGTIASTSRWVFLNCHLIASNGSVFDGTTSATAIRNMAFNNCILWNEDATTPDPVIKTDENYSILLRNCAYPTAAPPTHTTDSTLLPNISPVALAANPFTNIAGGDYSLTDAAQALLRITEAVTPGIPGFSQFGWIGAEPIAPAATSGGSKPALLGGAQYAY